MSHNRTTRTKKKAFKVESRPIALIITQPFSITTLPHQEHRITLISCCVRTMCVNSHSQSLPCKNSSPEVSASVIMDRRAWAEDNARELLKTIANWKRSDLDLGTYPGAATHYFAKEGTEKDLRHILVSRAVYRWKSLS